jgi:hypothetical protein
MGSEPNRVYLSGGSFELPELSALRVVQINDVRHTPPRAAQIWISPLDITSKGF